MNPTTDYSLTVVLLAPILAAGAVAIVMRWYAPAPPPARAPRRLSDDDLRRLYPLTAERTGKFHTGERGIG